ncbi:MAG: hypothetical protein ACK5PB_17310 [Pirellula sp.]|jgi:hypothetical protein
MFKGKPLVRVAYQFGGRRAFYAIMFTATFFAVACQVYLKRRFAETLRQDYAEYDSTFDLSIPFVVKHGVQFSTLDRSDTTYVYIFGYRRIAESSITISDPVISVPAS